jgi:hypothetical protein
MNRITVNLNTGLQSSEPLTPQEITEAEVLTAAFESKKPLLTIERIERDNPITHRALRELILTIGEAYPAGKNTVFYQRVLAAELAIQAERAKL